MASIQLMSPGGFVEVETWGVEDDPSVLVVHDRGSAGAWRKAAETLASAGRYVLLLGCDASKELEPAAASIRSVLDALTARPSVLADSFAGVAAVMALGEATHALASGIILTDGALSTQDSGRPIAFPDHIRTRCALAAEKATAPAMLLRAANRMPWTEAIEALAEKIPGLERADLDAPPHASPAELAEAFNAAIVEFLERRLPRDPILYQAGSDPRTLRDALGCFASGVTIVTTLDKEGRPVGLTANSFSSVSLDPPLILTCVGKQASSLAALRTSPFFAVNVLHIGQQPASARFSRKDEDRFSAGKWETWDTGAPILSGSLANFECLQHQVVDAGDHLIFIGRVQRARFEPRRDPLLYFRGKYRRLHFH